MDGMMSVKLGDVVEVDGIRMTCTYRKEFFAGWQYHFVYFSCGELKECEFCEMELVALGAKYVGNKLEEKNAI